MRSLPVPTYTRWPAVGEASPKRGKGSLRPFSWKTRRFSTTGQDIKAFFNLWRKDLPSKKCETAHLAQYMRFIQRFLSFSFETDFFLFGQIEKADLHEPPAERIEIPFQSKKSCKSALMQKSKPVCAPSCQQAENRGTASAFGSSRSVSDSSGVPQPVAWATQNLCFLDIQLCAPRGEHGLL